MSDFDKGKFYGKKKFNSGEKSSFGRSFFNSKTPPKFEKDARESDKSEKHKNIKQPTILLKARDQESRPRSPKPQKDNDTSTISITSTSSKEDNHQTPQGKEMQESAKLLYDGTLLNDNIQEYLQENGDFLVIGIVGKQSVGKSTIMNLLVHSKITESIKKDIFELNNETVVKSKCKNVFKVANSSSVQEKTLNVTSGIDFYVTDNRVMFLDCQPIGSAAILEDLIQNENQRLNVISDFILLESSEEIQGLQYLAFLLSVCHVIILTQDYFFDPNVIRFFLSAEMLKPTISNPEDEYIDHFPHLILLQNKAQISDFSPSNFEKMKHIYSLLLSKSKCHINSKLGLQSPQLFNTLNQVNNDYSINLFLIPEYSENEETFGGHPSLETLIKKLRTNILGSTKYPLTHVQLTEKTWLIYCSKVWDHIKKSNFFVEYNKLLP